MLTTLPKFLDRLEFKTCNAYYIQHVYIKVEITIQNTTKVLSRIGDMKLFIVKTNINRSAFQSFRQATPYITTRITTQNNFSFLVFVVRRILRGHSPMTRKLFSNSDTSTLDCFASRISFALNYFFWALFP